MKNHIYSILLFLSILISSCVSTHPDLNDGLYADIQTNKGDVLINLTFKETPITRHYRLCFIKPYNKNHLVIHELEKELGELNL